MLRDPTGPRRLLAPGRAGRGFSPFFHEGPLLIELRLLHLEALRLLLVQGTRMQPQSTGHGQYPVEGGSGQSHRRSHSAALLQMLGHLDETRRGHRRARHRRAFTLAELALAG